jgi:hypothetical protein
MLAVAIGAAFIASAASKSYDSPEVGVPGLYKGLIAWAFIWAFVDAYSIGANDVANAFANAVGSGTVTHKTACVIACIFEIIGVIALGSNVTDTIRSKVKYHQRASEQERRERGGKRGGGERKKVPELSHQPCQGSHRNRILRHTHIFICIISSS